MQQQRETEADGHLEGHRAADVYGGDRERAKEVGVADKTQVISDAEEALLQDLPAEEAHVEGVERGPDVERADDEESRREEEITFKGLAPAPTRAHCALVPREDVVDLLFSLRDRVLRARLPEQRLRDH